MNRVAVLKLGGSLVESARLPAWLAAATRVAAQRPLVIVTGGGSLADAVRAQQRALRYDDACAHRLAILAMQQNAWVVESCLRATGQAARSFEDPAQLQAHSGCGQPILWLPDRMCAAAGDIPCSWDITSDALAAWLARRIDAGVLVIAKSRAVEPAMAADALALADAGIVDAAFPGFVASLAQAGGPPRWLLEHDPARLATACGVPA